MTSLIKEKLNFQTFSGQKHCHIFADDVRRIAPFFFSFFFPAKSISTLDSICTRRLNKLTTKDHGPVVQSIVRLTSSLRGQLVMCFKTL